MIKRGLIVLAATLSMVIAGGQAVRAYDPLCTAHDAKGNCTAGPCATANSDKSPACQQNKQQQTAQGNPNPAAGPNGVLQKVADIMATLTGVIAVIIIIYAGIRYITSSGSAEGTKKAKDMIVNAVIGLIVVALAWSFVTFVVEKFIG